MTKPSSKLPHCRLCGEPVKLAWARLGPRESEEASFDASPDPAGNYMMQSRPVEGGGKRTFAVWLDDQEASSLRAQGVLLWKRHEVTCTRRPGRATSSVDPDWLAEKLAQLNLQGGQRGRT